MARSFEQPDQDLLLAFWKASMDRVVHYETQRERVTAGIFVLAGLILRAIGIDKDVTSFDSILSCSLIVVGAFGVLFCQKNFSRRRYHYSRARAFRQELDIRYGGKVIGSVLERTDAAWDRANGSNWFRNGDNLQFFWAGTPLFLSVLGVALLIFSLLHRAP